MANLNPQQQFKMPPPHKKKKKKREKFFFFFALFIKHPVDDAMQKQPFFLLFLIFLSVI